MPRVVVLPHPQLCPGGAAFDAPPGASLCDTLLANGISIEHACEKVGACATCHVVVRAAADIVVVVQDTVALRRVGIACLLAGFVVTAAVAQLRLEARWPAAQKPR